MLEIKNIVDLSNFRRKKCYNCIEKCEAYNSNSINFLDSCSFCPIDKWQAKENCEKKPYKIIKMNRSHDLNSKDGRINAFFDFAEPCFFDECERLRAEYIGEENSLKAQGKCSGCSKNALIGKYVQKIINLV